MNKSAADKWIAALESGRYAKGSGALRSHDNNFCALGVLLDWFGPEEWRLAENAGAYTWHGRLCTMDPETSKRLKVRSSTSLVDVSVLSDDSADFRPVIEYIRQNWRTL